jgi:hypothetical protein
MNNHAVKKEEHHHTIEELSQEALQILELLEKIENHTADLRKKLMAELKAKNKSVHLKLNDVNNS